MPDDAALLRQFAEMHSETAFAELVRRHIDAVYSSAVRRLAGDIHLAEDVTQQVFVALARRAAQVAHHPATSAWLHLTTRNLAAQAVRSERRRRAREQQHAAMPHDSSHPSSSVDWSRLAPVIDGAIDQLNERDRTAVLLRFIENRAFADIGRTLRISEDAARMRVDRALEKLRAILSRHGLSSTSTALALALTHHAVAAAPATLAANATSFALSTAASAAATSALGAFSLMTSVKFIGSAASIALLIVSFGAATYEISRAHADTAALLAARVNDSALVARLHTLNDQALAAEREAAQLAEQQRAAETAAAEPVRRATSTAATATAVAQRDPAAEGTAFMQRHPAVRQALADWFDAQTNYKYSAFYEQAGLTKEQIAQFQVLHRNGSLGRGLGPTTPHLQFRLSPPGSWHTADDQVAVLLGPEKFQEYRQFNATLPDREIGAQLASALAFSPSPLTAAQFDAFTNALVEQNAVTMTRTGPEYDWNVVTSVAATRLAPAQRDVLAALRTKSEFDTEYSRAAQAVSRIPTKP